MKIHPAFLVAAFAIGACTDEKITYITRTPFNPPPDAASGFLGYFTESTKQTTCGNCHVGHQADWVTTKHADAWADLQGSGHAVASCNGCHTVSEKGNSTGHAAGYNAVANAAYHDVQCESCHGPGYTHVQNPEVAANWPLASMVVDTAIANGCGGCHTGIHEPFVDQWIQSAHGSGEALSHATSATCTPCHEGKSAMTVKFGVSANFVEKTSTTPLHIVCIVCHDPHGTAGFDGQLRASVSTPTVDNLCIKCHSRSASPPWGVASATRGAGGPHGAQGLLVIGQSAGWIPPNFTYDTSLIVSSHGTTANPRLCATCHVTFTTITDKATGAFQLNNVGHLFEAIPCLDANGIPVAGGSCTQAQRDFTGCLGSGCHPSRASAVSSYNANVATIENLLDQIWKDVNANANIDSTDTGLLPQLVARAMRPGATAADTAVLNFGTTTTTIAKGTLFNAVLAATDTRAYFFGGTVLGKAWAAHQSSGNGVHNPFLLQALLVSSIAAMHSTYSLAPPVHQNLRIRATPPPGLKVSVR